MAAASDNINPNPFLEACISANITPVIPVAAVTLNPANMLGIADGKSTFKIV